VSDRKKSELLARLRELDWGEAASLRDGVLASLHTCIGLRRGEHVPGRPNASKVGGQPVLPARAPWPGPGLVFVAQIDLAACADLDPSGLLPRRGLLSFFAHEDEGSGEWIEVPLVRVLHLDADAGDLVQQRNPDAETLDSGAALEERTLVPGPCFELPLAELQEHEVAWEAREVLGEANQDENGEEGSRLLPRYTLPPADDNEDEDGDDDDDEAFFVVRLARRALRAIRNFGSHGPGRVLLALSGADLARQGDSHSIFGENTLYFCITEAHLKRRRFDRVRLYVGGGS
jgi:Domain of unknown function (DUF1963)